MAIWNIHLTNKIGLEQSKHYLNQHKCCQFSGTEFIPSHNLKLELWKSICRKTFSIWSTLMYTSWHVYSCKAQKNCYGTVLMDRMGCIVPQCLTASILGGGFLKYCVILHHDGLISVHHLWLNYSQLLTHQLHITTIGLCLDDLVRLQEAVLDYSITVTLNCQDNQGRGWDQKKNTTHFWLSYRNHLSTVGTFLKMTEQILVNVKASCLSSAKS